MGRTKNYLYILTYSCNIKYPNVGNRSDTTPPDKIEIEIKHPSCVRTFYHEASPSGS